jgi:NAD(P)-dependent dehydrogenase (short-subunit alcohol dehydrogenase family)
MGEQVESKVWFVTGASGGFGSAICDVALERGHRVVATVREQSGVSAFQSEHPGVLALPLDVTDARSVRRAVDHAVAELGRIDVLVNNAGYGHFGAIEELEEADIRAQLEVNLFGVIAVTRAVLPQLRRQRSGHIVQMSSLNGVVGLVGGGYYAASKFAVEGLSESLAQEVAPLGIRVTIVEPGPHRTGFAGEGARLADPIEDYAETVGAARRLLADLDGNQPGDPRRAAVAIIEAIEAPDPPLRLALGEYAVAGIREKLDQQRAELERWQDLSVSTAFANG